MGLVAFVGVSVVVSMVRVWGCAGEEQNERTFHVHSSLQSLFLAHWFKII